VYRWIDHTGELELELEASTEEEVFADALAAFAELVGDGGGTDSERREIELEGDDRDLLLADWLEELVYLADAQQFVPQRVTDFHLEAGRLRATVHGRRGNPSPLVKAVTRHRLSFESGATGVRARVVLDV
jgi:SHS2 domain-containing protein